MLIFFIGIIASNARFVTAGRKGTREHARCDLSLRRAG
jgi:hypothetical protein